MTATVSPGSDPGYLISSVGRGAEHYYLKAIEVAGEPPGTWLGAGAEELGLSGEVDHDLMSDMYSKFTHPQMHADVRASLSAIEAEPGSDEYKAEAAAIYDAARVGRRPYDYTKSTEEKVAQAIEDLGPLATPEQCRAVEMKVRQTAPAARSYYDVTFSAPKSYSLLHAGFQVEAARLREVGDLEGAAAAAAKADAVWDAWMEGVQAGLEFLQEEAGYARDGRHGSKSPDGAPMGRQVDAHRFTIASFRQHTSRDNDPQLHVHNAIWNRVQVDSVDPVTGEQRSKWLAIDGQEIYRHTKAAGHLAEKAADEALYRRFGYRTATRPDGVAREIVGISQEQRDKYSSRRMTITRKTAELATAWEEQNGRTPSAHELARMAQWATLNERKGKTEAVAREELLARWEADMVADTRESLAGIPAQVERASAQLERDERPLELTPGELESRLEFQPEEIVRRAVEAVQDQKSAWRRADLVVEISRGLPDCLGGLERHQVTALVNELADAALQPGTEDGVVRLTAPNLVPLPQELQRADGLSVYARHGARRFATETHLRREGRIIAKATEVGAPAVAQEAIEAAVAGAELNEGQEGALRSILGSGRRMEVVAAPAGTGKSRLAGALHDCWNEHVGPVIGLTVSQRAARVLADEGVTNAANITKFLHTNRRLELGAPVSDEDREAHRLRPGQLILVDEASMAETGQLDEIRRYADRAGAKVIYTGDDAQLESVGAGGMFAQLTEDLPNVHRLDEVMRFSSEWEKAASLALRKGDRQALVAYEDRGRLRGGTRTEMVEAAYQSWLADHVGGKASLLIAATNDQAAELAARARADLVRLGIVTEEGVTLRGETEAGVGDLLQLRDNNRQLVTASGERFATNRDVVKVLATAEDGAMTVAYDDGDTLELPASYVKAHVDLAYAGTVHAAQGRTVDTCHTLLEGAGTRESFYVAMTRGRDSNRAYCVTDAPGVPEEQRPGHVALLTQTLDNSSVEPSATKTLRDELEWSTSLAKHSYELEDIATQDAEKRFGQALFARLGDKFKAVRDSEAYGSLIRLGRSAEAAGHDALQIMRDITQRGLDDAKDVAKVLHWRAEEAVKDADRRQVRADEQQIAAVVEEQQRTVTGAVGDMQTVAGGQGEAYDHMEALAAQARQLPLRVGVLHFGQEDEERHRLAEERREAAEERADWRHRVAGIEGPVGDYARGVAELAEQRRLDLGQQLAEAEQLPEWASRALGPVPEDPIWRQRWIERAGSVAAYREAHQFEHERDAIGQRPGQGAVDVRTDWERAYRATGEPEERMDLVGASDATLRDMVERYERETAWAPPYVGPQLQEASTARAEAERDAVQKRIAAMEAETDEQRQELTLSVENDDALAVSLGEQVEQLETVHEARQAWSEHTAEAQYLAEQARLQMELRGPDLPKPEPEPAVEEAAEPAVEEEPQQEREEPRLTAEELADAVRSAGRATEILAEREQARAAEEAERQRRDEPHLAPAPEIEERAVDQGYEVEM